MKKFAIRFVLLTGGAVLLLILAAIVKVPAVAAYFCPPCYQLVPAGNRVFVDEGMSEDEVTRFRANLGEARDSVTAFFGLTQTNPVVLVCSTATCNSRLAAGNAKARTFGDRFIVVSPQGDDATILAHELAHAEVNGRTGLWKMIRGTLPAWLNEGIVVVASGDQRYLKTDRQGQLQCIVEPDENLPVSRRVWREEAGKRTRPIYAMAACRVLEMMQNGSDLNRLLDL